MRKVRNLNATKSIKCYMYVKVDKDSGHPMNIKGEEKVPLFMKLPVIFEGVKSPKDMEVLVEETRIDIASKISVEDKYVKVVTQAEYFMCTGDIKSVKDTEGDILGILTYQPEK